MNAPTVSIGLPFVNDRRTILASIRSVFAQTYADWELILIDDGSRDGTLGLARSIDDPRVQVHSDGVNRGLAARLNQIAALARGIYLARMDADDIMHPERIARQVAYLETNPTVDVVGTGAILIDKSGAPFAKRPARFEPAAWSVVRSAQLVHPSVMARSCWFQSNPYHGGYPRAEDHELWCRSWKAGCAIAEIPEYLLFYRYEFALSKQIGSYHGDRRIVSDYGPAIIGRPKTFALQAYLGAKIALWSASACTGLGNSVQAWRHARLSPADRLEAARTLSVVERTGVPGLISEEATTESCVK